MTEAEKKAIVKRVQDGYRDGYFDGIQDVRDHADHLMEDGGKTAAQDRFLDDYFNTVQLAKELRYV